MKNSDLQKALSLLPEDSEVYMGTGRSLLIVTGAEAAVDYSFGDAIEVVPVSVAGDPDPDEGASPAILLTTTNQRRTSKIILPGSKPKINPGLAQEMSEIDPLGEISFRKST